MIIIPAIDIAVSVIIGAASAAKHAALHHNVEVQVRWIRSEHLERIEPGQVDEELEGDWVAERDFDVQWMGLDDSVFAIGNHDPFSGANVLSRGLVGDVGGVAVATTASRSPSDRRRSISRRWVGV